jgi:hypothetical protein
LLEKDVPGKSFMGMFSPSPWKKLSKSLSGTDLAAGRFARMIGRSSSGVAGKCLIRMMIFTQKTITGIETRSDKTKRVRQTQKRTSVMKGSLAHHWRPPIGCADWSSRLRH